MPISLFQFYYKHPMSLTGAKLFQQHFYSTSIPSINSLWKFAQRTKPVEFYERLLKYSERIPGNESLAREGLSKAELQLMEGKASPITKILSLEHAQRDQFLAYNIHLAIQTFQRHQDDIGSHEVQTAITTVRIIHLKEHCEKNRKDHRSKRLLIQLRYKRTIILKSLKQQSLERYFTIIRDLRLSPAEVNFTTVPK